MAYVVRSGRRRLLAPIWGGVGVAVAVSLAFGALLTFGPRGLTFEAQELIGGTLSIVAVGFVTWMVFWMARASRGIAAELRGRIDAASASTVSLVVVAALAVGREGLETALFLWAATRAAADAQAGTTDPLLGAGLGIATAVVLGWLLYRGALRINLARFFAVTGAFLIVVAAGVLSYGVHDLQEARILPGLNDLLFDVSDVVEPGSWLGTLLKGVFNFSPATTRVEALAWLLYLVPTMLVFVVMTRRGRAPRRRVPASVPTTT